MLARFPPVFHDSPLAYAFALFSLALISALSLAMLIGFLLDERRARDVDVLIENRAHRLPDAGGILLWRLHRLIVSGFLVTFLFGALPDVVVLLAWGEAGDEAMYLLFQVDRLFDGLTIFPLALTFWLSTVTAQAVDHRLFIDPAPIRLHLRWTAIRDKMKIGGMVLCIAIGVTLYKAGLA